MKTGKHHQYQWWRVSQCECFSLLICVVVLRQWENFLRLATHPKVLADYYSLYFCQPLDNRLLHQLIFCGYETPWQFWLPNRAKAWVKILCQLTETIMVHQRRQRKHMYHQGNDIYLKLALLWMFVSIRMTRNEVIWKSATNTYLFDLSPLSTSIIA